MLQVYSGANDLVCRPVATGLDTDVVRWVSSDPAVATVRKATNADMGLGAGLSHAAFLKGVSPGSTTVVAFVALSNGAREVESRPLPVSVIP